MESKYSIGEPVESKFSGELIRWNVTIKQNDIPYATATGQTEPEALQRANDIVQALELVQIDLPYIEDTDNISDGRYERIFIEKHLIR